MKGWKRFAALLTVSMALLAALTMNALAVEKVIELSFDVIQKETNGLTTPYKSNAWEFTTKNNQLTLKANVPDNHIFIITGDDPGKLNIVNYGTIKEGTFNSPVTNRNVIAGGTFKSTVTNDNEGKIENGTFEAQVNNFDEGMIEDGIFTSSVTNANVIAGGTFHGDVANANANGQITSGTFHSTVTNNMGCHIQGGIFTETSNVTNSGVISRGTFHGTVKSSGAIRGGEFSKTSTVSNNNQIDDGTFHGTVNNFEGNAIGGGTFTETSKVQNSGGILKGTFHGTVNNNSSASISNGTFTETSNVTNGGTILGGTFRGILRGSGELPKDHHKVTLSKTGEGTAKLSSALAKQDTEITLTVTLNPAQQHVTVTKDGEPLSANADGTYAFTMPDQDVTLAVNIAAHTLTSVPEVPATTEQTGTKAHQKCSVCQTLVLDGKVVTLEGLVLPKLEPAPEEGGSSSGPSSYTPSIKTGSGGQVTVTPDRARRGDTVTITPRPDDGYAAAQVRVTDRNGKPVDVEQAGDGTWRFTQPSGRVTIAVTFAPVEAAWSNPFADVHAEDWYYEAVQYVCDTGLMAGTSADAFQPGAGMTRGMVVTTLGRLADVDASRYPDGSFADVAAGAYYQPYVNWAAQAGIVTGTDEATFSPDDGITREQLAVILKNYADRLGYTYPATLEGVTFADAAQISAWAADAVQTMQRAGVLTGTDGNRFDPQGTATRAEVAAVLHRFAETVVVPQGETD